MRAVLFAFTAAQLQVGMKIPPSEMHLGFPPTTINIAERVAGKKVVLVGLPGAFTPTWSTRQVPGYKEDADKLKALGVQEVIIYCVNDGAVMSAWGDDQGVGGSEFITMMADTFGSLTQDLGTVLNHPGPNGKFGSALPRSKRVAMYVVDGVVKIVRIAEKGPAGEEDPAGDDFPEVTLAPAMIKAIAEFEGKAEL